jgi:hypothetical protein
MKYTGNIALFALMATLVLSVAGCYTYEEGPRMTRQKPEELLVDINYWAVKEVLNTKNNTFLTDQYAGQYMDFERTGLFTFIRYNVPLTISNPPFTKDTVVNATGYGTWNFLPSDKYTVEMLYSFSYPDRYNDTIFYGQEIQERWTITRLTEEELWLDNDSIRIKYEQRL